MKSATEILSRRPSRLMCQSGDFTRGSLIVLKGTSLCLDHYLGTLAAIAGISRTAWPSTRY